MRTFGALDDIIYEPLASGNGAQYIKYVDDSVTLTLADATDLPYFEVGDKVEGLDTPATFALSPAFSTTTYTGNSSLHSN